MKKYLGAVFSGLLGLALSCNSLDTWLDNNQPLINRHANPEYYKAGKLKTRKARTDSLRRRISREYAAIRDEASSLFDRIRCDDRPAFLAPEESAFLDERCGSFKYRLTSFDRHLTEYFVKSSIMQQSINRSVSEDEVDAIRDSLLFLNVLFSDSYEKLVPNLKIFEERAREIYSAAETRRLNFQIYLQRKAELNHNQRRFANK